MKPRNFRDGDKEASKEVELGNEYKSDTSEQAKELEEQRGLFIPIHFFGVSDIFG
jgi:hypothetical protein